MRFALFSIPAALAFGYLTGGRLAGFASVRVRWPLLALAAILCQLAPVSGTAGVILLVISFVLLMAFASANARAPGFPLILLGLALNFTVIAVNHGMPVTRHALVASGQAETLPDLREHGGAKHHLATPTDELLWLGDVIPIGPPVHQAVSVGDIGAHLGAAWFVIAAMRRHKLSVIEEAGRGGDPAGVEA